MTRHDIAIAGCGPAGLAAALFLIRQGHRITLVERFTAPKPVGSGLLLQPSGLAVLDALGLNDPIIAQAPGSTGSWDARPRPTVWRSMCVMRP